MKEELPYLTFKGHTSLEYSLIITKKELYKSAERDVTYTSIPGRNGDLIIDNGRYKNAAVSYEFALLNDTKRSFSALARLIKNWLCSDVGYFMLWDTYDKDYFRLASISGEVDISQELNDLGTLSVSFSCKPMRYSFDGLKSAVFSSAGEIYNPEAFPSKPYIKVTGSGIATLTINDITFTLMDIDDYIELDFEIPNAFKGDVVKNNKVSGADISTFKLSPGVNSISWTGSVDSVEIIPRWCCL